MGANPEFPGVDWIGPAAAGHGSYSHRYFVWHCTENPTSDAVGEANFALNRTDGIGTHFVADESRAVQTLETFKAVGHVGSTVGNQHGIALEMCGTLTSSTAHYQAVINRAMPAVRAACAKWDIPARWLTSAQANDGVSKGWLTHDDARRYWGNTTHTDPGPNFPRQYAIDLFSRPSVPYQPPSDPTLEADVIYQVTSVPAGATDVVGSPVPENGQCLATPNGPFNLTGNEFFSLPVSVQPVRMKMPWTRLVALCGAMKSRAVDPAAVAADLAADENFLTAIANAVGASVKDQFGPAFDARIVAAVNVAEDS